MIIRAEHTDGYFCLLNSVARDSRLSFEARGFLVYLLSMSDEWEFSIKGLAFETQLSKHTIMRLVTELKNAGYIKQSRERNERGQLGAPVWEVYEAPVLEGSTKLNKNLTLDKPNSGESLTWAAPNSGERRVIRNTNIEEIPINKEIPKVKKYIPGRGEFLNVYVSDSEFEKLTDRFGAQERDARIEDLSRYLANHPRKKYASHYATILAWERKDKKAVAGPASNPKNKTFALGIYQNVFLSNEEQKVLYDNYGYEDTARYIDRLSIYLNENPNKSYQSHKSTIEKWIVKDKGALPYEE